MPISRQFVLIVDDSPTDRALFRRHLERADAPGFAVFEAETGEQAQKICRQHKVDCILLDYVLPDVDGLEWLAEMYSGNGAAYCPVVMLTGRGDEAVAVKAMQNGAQDYLVKGQITPISLLLVIENAIEKFTLKQRLRESEQLRQASLDNMLDCFGIYQAVRDASGRITDFRIEYVNRAACQTNFLSKEDQVGELLCEVLPAHRASGLFAEYCEVVETGQSLEKEALFYTDHFDGKRGLIQRAFDIRAWKMGDGFAASWRDVTARKQATEQMHLLQNVITNTNDVVVITEAEPIDEPGPRILYVNPAFTRMTGYTPEEAVGKTPRLLQGPKTDRATCEAIRAALVAWQPIRVELINYHKDGSEFWVELDIAPVADETGWYTHWIAIQRDITERKEAEKALARSEARFRRLMDANVVGIAFGGADGSISAVNDEYARIMGYAKEEALAGVMNWQEMTPPEFIEVSFQALAQMEATGIGPIIEKEMIRKDGTRVPIIIAGAMVEEDTSEHFTIVLDNTERKAQEKILYQQAQIIAQIHGAVIVVDMDGLVTFWNTGAERLYGYTEAEALGRHISFLYFGEDEALFQNEVIGPLLAHGHHETELRNRRKSGEECFIYLSLSTLRDAQGTIYGMIGYSVDVTEQKQQQSQINDLNTRLRRSMAESHHRIKNNLQVLAALMDMQMMDGGETVAMSAMARLKQHVRSLASLHDILTLDTKEGGDINNVSMLAALERIVPIMQVAAGDRQIVLDVEEISLPLKQSGSFILLVNELVSNAVKHGKGDIEITLKQTGGQIRLEVCDDGPGLPDGFDPRKDANTGMELIESAGRWDLRGQMFYENRQEGGARVGVTFAPPARPELDATYAGVESRDDR